MTYPGVLCKYKTALQLFHAICIHPLKQNTKQFTDCRSVQALIHLDRRKLNL